MSSDGMTPYAIKKYGRYRAAIKHELRGRGVPTTNISGHRVEQVYRATRYATRDEALAAAQKVIDARRVNKTTRTER